MAALDRYSGEVVWDWKAPQGSGFVSLLLDGDRLIAAVSGYIYCLDPIFGQQVWENPMKGYGLGITSIASRARLHVDRPRGCQEAAGSAGGGRSGGGR